MTGRGPLGVGPLVFTPVAGWFIAAGLVDAATDGTLRFDLLPTYATTALAAALVVSGLVVYGWAMVVLGRARRNDTLATQGPYRMVRHPAYAAFIWLVLPGVAMYFRNWLMLAGIAVAWVLARLALPREEKHLVERFGDDYIDYARHTGTLLRRPGEHKKGRPR